MNAPQAARSTTPESTPNVRALAGHTDSLDGHPTSDFHSSLVVEGQFSPQASEATTPNVPAPAGSQTARPTNDQTTPMLYSSAGHQTSHAHASCDVHAALGVADDLPGGHPGDDAQKEPAAGDQAPPTPANHDSVPTHAAPVLVDNDGRARATAGAAPSQPSPVLADPFLALAADVLDDLEKVRIANENRLRQLTRTATDADGEERGFGLDESHPDVARLAALVSMLADGEHKAELNLARQLRKHPLYPWLNAQKGVGAKQAARLLAAIGDPYWNDAEDRPRRGPAELWAYAGYHVTHFPVDHVSPDARMVSVGGEQAGGGPDHRGLDVHPINVGAAPKRARGQRANWSAAAKMRTFLIAESTMKQLRCPKDDDGAVVHADGCACSPYRIVYDEARAKYADAIHHAPCVRCGPKGKPAPTGSPLSDGHKMARALRIVSKTFLRDLWREAKRLHEAALDGQCAGDAHSSTSVEGHNSPQKGGEPR